MRGCLQVVLNWLSTLELSFTRVIVLQSQTPTLVCVSDALINTMYWKSHVMDTKDALSALSR